MYRRIALRTSHRRENNLSIVNSNCLRSARNNTRVAGSNCSINKRRAREVERSLTSFKKYTQDRILDARRFKRSTEFGPGVRCVTYCAPNLRKVVALSFARGPEGAGSGASCVASRSPFLSCYNYTLLNN